MTLLFKPETDMKYPISLEGKKKLYRRAKDAYYNDDSSGMTDEEFDRLESMIKAEDSTWVGLKKTGATVTKKAKVKLPCFLPSLAKAYPKDWPKWLDSHPSPRHLVMNKLDGSSVLARYAKGNPYQLITRGDGEVGGDISFLLPYLNLPRNIEDKTAFDIRCEAVVSTRNFKKYADQFDNSRQMVAGLLNRKLDKAVEGTLWAIDFVALGVIGLKVRDSLRHLDKLGFNVVERELTTGRTAAGMAAILAHRKTTSPYEIDGLVICPEDARMIYEDSDKPKWATAFKNNLEDDAPQTTVREIVWQLSHRGRIIPKVRIDPLKLDGAVVTYATAHNAKWMQDRGIGPGAVIKVLRSGGVIPKIVEVVKRGKFSPPNMPYHLEGVHFMLSPDADAKFGGDVAIKALTKFLSTLGAEFIAAKTIQTLYEAGCTTPFHYMKLAHSGSLSPMVKAGVGAGMAAKIMVELQRVFTDVPLMRLMVASNLFGVGVGERRLTALQKSGLSMTRLLLLEDRNAMRILVRVPGFQERTAATVVEGIKPFNKFLKTAQKYITVRDVAPKSKKVVTGGRLSGQTVSFTGYRDKEQEAAIEAAGGTIVPFSLTKTQTLLVKAGGKASTKADKAREAGIRVCGFTDLKIFG